MTRILLWITVAAALGWAGYWFVGAAAVTRLVAEVQTRAEADGLTLRLDPTVNGFPNRFDLTLSDPVFQDPASGIGWRAPFLQILALSYQPHRLIIVWPHDQTLTARGRGLHLASTDMRASLAVRPRPALPLDRAILIAEGLRITDAGGGADAGRAEDAGGPPGLAIDTLRIALRAAEGGQARYDLGGELLGLAPDPALIGPVLARMPPGTALPPRIDRAHLAAQVTLDHPLDRAALRDWAGRAIPPRPREIALQSAQLSWGGLDVTATGTLRVGADRVLSGQIDTQTTGWRQIAPLAEAAGLIRPEMAQTFANALQVLAGLSEPATRLDLPLILKDGRMSFGPLDLGPAPRLR